MDVRIGLTTSRLALISFVDIVGIWELTFWEVRVNILGLVAILRPTCYAN